ncbi:exodeoxyribonuclease VII large subunit [Propionispora sp. 2/2-37]|uniref:exodeoxyribonuclease VII large subunit n=1 Tax=Propionispora sp. 2/2-37 TaxID=1677858 RepID=UPI0006BB567D|nr:exodeoxyribonuclease VII large subunit [Propionispora sp. 2/2-37]
MKILSVSDVTKYIKQLFTDDIILSSIYIRGEISNFKRHHSGHCYFTLKDGNATIRSVMFKSRTQFLRFTLRDGLKVIAGGQVSVFERDGQYQLYVEQILPDGIGELTLAFNQLKDKLMAEGLFDESRKTPLPLLPGVVGIVTSPTGAAIRDIITVAKRRYPGISLIVYPVQVQGPEAPQQISHAIRVLNRLGEADVIITGRGGGSIEELWAFNEEQVVRAIAESTIPIVSAVGHQTDYTLADFAADRRAATPSQAAELAVPDVQELCRYIRALQSALVRNINSILQSNRALVCQYLENRFFRQPHLLIKDKHQTLDGLFQRLKQSIHKLNMDKRHQFQITAEKLSMLNPLGVLARGYSIVTNHDHQVVRKAQQVVNGENVNITLHRGELAVKVISVKEDMTSE